MVALSAAQGFAQACGRPAAVIVHVDVGTQVKLLLINSCKMLCSFDILYCSTIGFGRCCAQC